jgi:glycerophosphoryl diester phosphodiesterase
MSKKSTAKKTPLMFNNKILFLTDMSLNILLILYYVPFVNNGLQYVMELTKQSYITSQNLKAFLFSPPTILLMLLILFTLPMFLYYKVSSLIYYCNSRTFEKKPSLLKILFYGLYKTLHVLKKGKIGLLFYTIPFYILTTLPVLFGLTFQADIKTRGHLDDEVFLKGLICVILIFAAFIIFSGAFVIPICMNENISFIDGFKSSKALLNGRGWRTFLKFSIVNLILTIGYFLFYYFILFLTAVSVYLFTDKAFAVTVFLSIYPGISFYAIALYSVFTFIININLITSLYHLYLKENTNETITFDSITQNPFSKLKKVHRYIVDGLLVCILIASVANFHFNLRNDSFYFNMDFGKILISSHRGNSSVAPENTIPALENAIIANSDYAEIDVQQTKDGSIILLHDKSLSRTAGVNRLLYEMNKEDLTNLDVGSWFGMEFLNTRIPTLEEVLVYCKGKIKLNIEIKSYQRDTNFEEQLVALIEQYEYEHQCIISSSNYASLKRVKELNNEIKTGLILSAVFGNFYQKEYIDFFSIRSSYITKNLVENAHHSGKEIHAWTVNTTKELERMKSIGVDCIITDKPTLARRVLYRDDTNDTFIQLINRMIINRTFYPRLND